MTRARTLVFSPSNSIGPRAEVMDVGEEVVVNALGMPKLIGVVERLDLCHLFQEHDGAGVRMLQGGTSSGIGDAGGCTQVGGLRCPGGRGVEVLLGDEGAEVGAGARPNTFGWRNGGNSLTNTQCWPNQMTPLFRDC